ncbi:MAG: hypothetical protein K6A37_04085 [Saccharofermentans sp.]|nr:hypothetical protein [Saccharofermentans sp.]
MKIIKIMCSVLSAALLLGSISAAVYEMIRPYIAQDPTAFYSADAFDNAYNTFRQVASLRAQSIRLQLDGQLSAVYEDQVPESRVDASDVDVMDMSRIF